MSKKNSKNASRNASRVASGTTTPAVQQEPVKQPDAWIGINFGQSFSSIAVINKEGLADCIANDDGERQIASALSFNGSEEYSGVPARIQLVRNPENTILGFRNLLGKTYDEVKSIKQPYNSAPIVNASGTPAFTVTINEAPVTLTAHQVTVRYLSVLLSYATDFLGRKITGAVLPVPANFTEVQTKALVAAAEEAGVKVVQTISEPAATLNAYHSTELAEEEESKKKSSSLSSSSSSIVDRNTIILDVGGSSTTVTVVAVRDGLFAPLATVYDPTLGGDMFDAKLIEWFSKEFTKKTKVPLASSNHRALMKLRLAVEVTKKSLSASNSAPCSVESLAEGMDFHGSINRMRFDLLSSSIYSQIISKVQVALKDAKLDPLQIQEVILIGGTTRLPALTEKLLNLFPEDSITITSQIDSDEVVAKGAALQALSLSKAPSTVVPKALGESSVVEPGFLAEPIGLMNNDQFITLIESHTALPVRRIIDFGVPVNSKELLLSLWEGKSEIKVEQPSKKDKSTKKSGGGGFLGFGGSKKDDDEDEDDDDDEPEEIRTLIITARKALADLVIKVDPTLQGKGKTVSIPKVRVTIVVEATGKATVEAAQLKEGAVPVVQQF